MTMFWRKHEAVEKMLADYFATTDECFGLFEKAFATYLESGQGEAFEAAVLRTHEAESHADDLRRDIEYTLYGQALLPESRGDLLGLLEAFDQIPNAAETVAFVLRTQRIILPPAFVPSYKHLVDLSLQAYYLTRKAVNALLSNPKVTLHATKEVDHKESECDRAERQLISQIFDSDLDTANKLILKDLVVLMGHISDVAEKTADRIAIIAIKRQI